MERDNESALSLDVIIEIPRGSFLKRDADGTIDFVSPFPCPFNYGASDAYSGMDGDALDAAVLGPRVPRGTRMTVRVFGAVQLIDRGVVDDKLICGDRPPGAGPLGAAQRFWILLFFKFYAVCKRLLYWLRGSPGATYCAGWCDPKAALERAQHSPQRPEGPANNSPERKLGV